MMSRHLAAGNWHRLLGPIALAAVLSLAGCGNSEKLYPVSGTVTLGGTPLTAGVVTLVPENPSAKKTVSVGTIGADGKYTVSTDNSTGAPAGKYKIAISTAMPPGPNVKPGEKPPMGTPINPRYSDAETSQLAFEVVPNPAEGRYDLKLNK